MFLIEPCRIKSGPLSHHKCSCSFDGPLWRIWSEYHLVIPVSCHLAPVAWCGQSVWCFESGGRMDGSIGGWMDEPDVASSDGQRWRGFSLIFIRRTESLTFSTKPKRSRTRTKSQASGRGCNSISFAYLHNRMFLAVLHHHPSHPLPNRQEEDTGGQEMGVFRGGAFFGNTTSKSVLKGTDDWS